ncbi:NAD-dependent epimerase/dehydratase family protein [Rhizobium beringeri]
MPRYILVTGGAGFIGSHICKSAVARRHDPCHLR